MQLLYFTDRKTTEISAVAARQFAEWYTTSGERMLELATNMASVPVKIGLNRVQLSEATQGFAEQFETSYPASKNPKMNDVWAPFETAVLEAFETEADVGPLLDDAAAEIRQSDRWE